MNVNPRISPLTAVVVVVVVIAIFGGFWLWRGYEASLDVQRSELADSIFAARKTLDNTNVSRTAAVMGYRFKRLANADALADEQYGGAIAVQRAALASASDALSAFDRKYPRIRARVPNVELRLEAYAGK